MAERLHNRFALTTVSIMQQAIVNLGRGVRRPWILTGDHFDESRLDDGLSGVISDFFFYKFCVAVYCGRTDMASDIRGNLGSHAKTSIDAYEFHYFQFLSALVDIALESKPKKIKRHLKNLKKYASYNKAVFGSKYLLALGGSLRLKGDPGAAAVYRDAAAAEENGFLFEQALACECLGRIAEAGGDDDAAGKQFDQAIKLYRQWGLKWKQGLFDHETQDDPVPEGVKTEPVAAAPDPVDWQAGPSTRIGNPGAEQSVDDLLGAMKTMSGATIIHVAYQAAQCWKSRVYIDDNGIHRPATFVPLPEKMLAFACATGEVIQADADSIEEQFLDTLYFWKRRPSSLLVIPGN